MNSRIRREMGSIIDMIVEVALQYPKVSLDDISSEVLSNDYFVANRVILYPVTNINYSQRIIDSFLSLNQIVEFYLQEKHAIPQLIEKAKSERASELEYLRAQPFKSDLVKKLINQLKLPLSDVLEIVRRISYTQIRVLSKINLSSMQALNEIIENLMFHAIPLTCNNYIDATNVMRPLEEAVAQIKAVIKGQPASLVAHDDWFSEQPYDFVTKIKDYGITEDHLLLLSSSDKTFKTNSYLRMQERQQRDNLFPNMRPKPVDNEQGDLIDAMNSAMRELVVLGYDCLDLEKRIYRLATTEGNSISTKIHRIEEFVTHEKNIKIESLPQTELSPFKNRRLMAGSSVGLATNSAPSPYATPFDFTLRFIKSTINSVTSLQIQDLLTSAAIYGAATLLPSITRSSVGFFVTAVNTTAAAEPTFSTALTCAYR
ncbi:MAG: hypothetical protein V4501_05060 [Pseudomonadota bacterium]